MKKIVLGSALVVAATLNGCGMAVSEKSAVDAANTHGFTDVKITAKHVFFVDWHGCGKDDDVAFKATATNPVGKRVNITICSGWLFKGATIRTN